MPHKEKDSGISHTVEEKWLTQIIPSPQRLKKANSYKKNLYNSWRDSLCSENSNVSK